MSSQAIYLDHHATTPCDPRVVEAMIPHFSNEFGNAASHGHALGRAAKLAVVQARAELLRLIGGRIPEELVFTSGATESNNLALRGVIGATGGGHVVTSAIEHACVLETCAYLESSGVEVTRLPVGADGLVSPGDLEAAIRPDTALVSVMAVNNEVGTIQPIRALSAIAHRHGALFHTDAAQALGRVALDVERDGIDLLSMSAHKIEGPKGIGALYVRRAPRRVQLQRQMHGGGQEGGLRAGTLNVPAIVGFGVAAGLCRQEGPAEAARLRVLRDRLLATLERELPGVRVHGSLSQRVGCNLNLRFDGVRCETLQSALPTLAFAGSAACSAGKPEASHVLRAMGVPAERIADAVRIGLGRTTTAGEVTRAAELFVAAVRRLRGPSHPPSAAGDPPADRPG